MRSFSQWRRRSRSQLGFAFVLLSLSLSLEAGEIKAQSGRRAERPSPPASSPAPTSSQIDVAEEARKPLAPGALSSRVKLLVGRQGTSKHFHTEDQIFASFIKQLNRYDNIEATSVGETKEDQAVERARAESEAFVILLKFDIDSFQNGTIILNSQDLQIEYFVLAPHTGKKQTKGKVYFQAIGGGRMRKSNWPNGTPIRITPEATGIEAADGLYFWLRLAAAKKPAS